MSQDIINIISPFILHEKNNIDVPLGISIYIQLDLQYIKIITIHRCGKTYIISITSVHHNNTYKFNNYESAVNMVNVMLLRYDHMYTISFNIMDTMRNEILYDKLENHYNISNTIDVNKYYTILKSLLLIINGNLI